MTVLVIIGITLLATLGMSTLLLWYDVHHQKHSKPVYSKEVLEKLIQDLKQEIKHKIANGEDFRLESDLDYLEYYENELKKYQKEK